jgi:ornithine cyclodeaminase/alanine dehydrogenase-like protein (mu-crystallin family)
MRLVDATALSRLLPIAAAIAAIEEGFRAPQRPEMPQRSALAVGTGSLLVMPAVAGRAAGVKLVTVDPANPGRGLPLVGGVYVLFDAETLQPRAVIDGPALTAVRTSAVSALVTRHLARPESRRLLLVGAGVQARAHLHAIRAVLEIEEVLVAGRDPGRVAALVGEARELGVAAAAASPVDTPRAEVICLCTTSDVPVLDGSQVAPGTHVNAVGAYRPNARETDDALVRQARIVVEDRVAALAEAGDLRIPIDRGVIGPDAVVADLWELVGGARVRRSDEDVTLFKSVGLGYEDLLVASAALAAG